jgi:trigger factor
MAAALQLDAFSVAGMVRILMQVSVQRLSPTEVELEVQVPADTVTVELDKAYSTLQKRAHIRGFRPGKAPRDVLTRLYGPQVASDVMNQIVRDVLPKVLVDKTLTPITTPLVEPGKLEPKAPFSFKARFEVTPEIEDVKYEGLELRRPKAEVTDAMVDEQLEQIRKIYATLKTPEPLRDTREGDVITIDFTLEVDGSEIKDAGGNGVQIELGSGQALPELDAALRGKPLNVPIQVEAVFPETHPRDELKGKKGKFNVTITDLKEKVLPALDDELAKQTGVETLVELRANTHTRLTKQEKDRADLAVAEQIVDQLGALNPIEVPKALVDQQRRMMEAEITTNARRMGRQVTRAELDGMKEKLDKDAERKVRAGLIMAAIARKLEVKVTDEDFENALKELAEESGKNVAKLRVEYRDKQKRDILVGMILEDKILDIIEKKAKITQEK